MAREIINGAVEKLKVTGPDVEEVLNYHFRLMKAITALEKTGFLKTISNNWTLIQGKLSGHVVLCLNKNLQKHQRGWTDSGRMHLNLAILAEDEDQRNSDMAIDRTIIHEASHSFAGMPGTGVDQEIYQHDDQYVSQTPDEAIQCADSYAWTAISLHDGRLLTKDSFSNMFGCLTHLDNNK